MASRTRPTTAQTTAEAAAITDSNSIARWSRSYWTAIAPTTQDMSATTSRPSPRRILSGIPQTYPESNRIGTTPAKRLEPPQGSTTT